MHDNMSEIEKLSKKLAQNPTSKFFIPLGEEYAKADLYDEAIEVLLEGMKNYPDYPSAKVALGKVYLKKGMLNEARKEFEEVLSGNPDNLLCYRKLAIIYKDNLDFDKARDACGHVLTLNPKDKEMLAVMEAVNKEEAEVSDVSILTDEHDADDISTTDAVAEEEDIGEENSQFDASDGELTSKAPEEREDGDVEDISSSQPVRPDDQEEENIFAELPETSVKEYIDFPDSGGTDDDSPEKLRLLHEASEVVETVKHEDISIEMQKNKVKLSVEEDLEGGEAPAAMEILQPEPGDAEAAEKDNADSEEEAGMASLVASIQSDGEFDSSDEDNVDIAEDEDGGILTPSVADIYIEQGDYEKGLKIYKQILENDPGDAESEKKLEELEMRMEAMESSRTEVESTVELTESGSSDQETSPEKVEHPLAEAGKAASNVEEEHPKMEKNRHKINKLNVWLDTLRRERSR